MPEDLARGKRKAAPRERDAQATRGRILAAVGSLLVREGFGALGVNAVARAAGVDSPEGEGGFLRRRCIFGAPFGKAPSRI